MEGAIEGERRGQELDGAEGRTEPDDDEVPPDPRHSAVVLAKEGINHHREQHAEAAPGKVLEAADQAGIGIHRRRVGAVARRA